MSDSYLEVTYRHGRSLAAYYYLPRTRPAKSVRTRRMEPGLVIDYSAKGQPLGIEITAPSKLSMAALNRVLQNPWLRTPPTGRLLTIAGGIGRRASA